MELELADVLDGKTGDKTGETIDLRIAHRNGTWHGSIHLWVISTDKKRVLLQKRSAEKFFFPSIWDISVGGHITAGDEPEETVLREASEELDIDTSKYEMEYVTRVQEDFVNNGITSNEFVYVYKLFADIDIDSIHLQEEEVSDCRWFTKKEFKELIKNNEIINHVEEFKIINKILKG